MVTQDYYDLFIHKLLLKNFFIVKYLSRGASGIVWLAYDLKKNNYVAIKSSNFDTFDDVKKEYEIYKSLKQHINISYLVKIFQAFEYTIDNESFYCIVMELYQFSLYDIILYSKINKLSDDFLFYIIKKIILILHNLHIHNIIYCDLKPENFLLKSSSNNLKTPMTLHELKKLPIDNINFSDSDSTDDSDTPLSIDSVVSNSTSFIININDITDIVISDFESCVHIDNIKKYPDIFTCYYIPPELILGLTFDTSFDIWSFGCVLYELITGNILFDTSDYRTHLHLISHKLQSNFPSDLLNLSNKKDMYFLYDSNILKPIFDTINTPSLIDELSSLQINTKFITILLSCLKINKNDRISSKEILSLL